jgi:hypothetical protein
MNEHFIHHCQSIEIVEVITGSAAANIDCIEVYTFHILVYLLTIYSVFGVIASDVTLRAN